MSANKTDDLSIAHAIDLLEAPLVEIRKEIPGYSEFLMIVPEDEDLELLSDFIDSVNLEVDAEALKRAQVVALDANGFKEWYAMITGIIPFAALWASIRKVCGANRCTIKVKAGDDEIDVSAASEAEAERLFHCAARFIIFRLGSEPTEENNKANKAEEPTPNPLSD